MDLLVEPHSNICITRLDNVLEITDLAGTPQHWSILQSISFWWFIRVPGIYPANKEKI